MRLVQPTNASSQLALVGLSMGCYPRHDAGRVCLVFTASGLRHNGLGSAGTSIQWWDGRKTALSGTPLREIVMKAMKKLLVKLTRDEQGGEVLEYALIAGLIVVAAIAVIGAVGGKVLARWNSLNTGL